MFGPFLLLPPIPLFFHGSLPLFSFLPLLLIWLFFLHIPLSLLSLFPLHISSFLPFHITFPHPLFLQIRRLSAHSSDRVTEPLESYLKSSRQQQSQELWWYWHVLLTLPAEH